MSNEKNYKIATKSLQYYDIPQIIRALNLIPIGIF